MVDKKNLNTMATIPQRSVSLGVTQWSEIAFVSGFNSCAAAWKWREIWKNLKEENSFLIAATYRKQHDRKIL